MPTTTAPAAPAAPATTQTSASPSTTSAPASLLGSDTQTASNGNTSPAWNWASADGKLSEGWLDKLGDGLKGEASLRSIDSLPSLAKSYVETKRMIGKRLEMPAPDGDPEAIAAWRKTVGAPEAPEGYLGDAKSLRPQNIPETMWNAETEKGFLSVAHKHSLPPAAVKDIMDFYGQSLGGEIKGLEEKQAAHLAAEGAKLQQAWGDKHAEFIDKAARMAETIGLPKDHPIFQHSEVVMAFEKMTRLLSEDKLVRGEGSGLSGTLRERMYDITDPKSTSHAARAYRGEFGADEQARAQSTLHDLMKSQQK